MLKVIVSNILLASAILITKCGAQATGVGEGKWYIMNVKKCDNADAMEMKIDVFKHKLNRTHDVFDASMELQEPLDETYSVRIDVCKLVDGGCKPYQVLSDNNFVAFVKKYGGENVPTAMKNAQIPNEDFPVPKGTHKVKDFLFDYDQLPESGPIGEYIANAYILRGTEEKACLEAHMRFEESDEDYED